MSDTQMASCLDAHVHIEKGPYTVDWLEEFVETATRRHITEICFLEHCYRFAPFVPLYDKICRENAFFQNWFQRKAGIASISAYLKLAETMGMREFPVKMRFGLEVCYMPGTEEQVYRITKDLPLDFLVGSIHTVGSFAFDHRAALWKGQDVDSVYDEYFRMAVQLATCGLFDGMAHPDSIALFGHRPTYSLLSRYEALATALAKSGMYAEQNSGVYRRCPTTGRLGMDPALLMCMQKHGVRIVTASDAHVPEDVGEGISLWNQKE